MSETNARHPTQLLLVVLVVLAAYAFFQSPYFSIREIRVSGHQYYSAEILISKAGITAGDNIFACSTRQAAVRLTQLPFVQQAKVRRRFPNALEIKVWEVTPIAMVYLQSQFWGISERGELLGPLPEDYPILPVVTGLDLEEFSKGYGQGSAKVAAYIVSHLNESLRNKISEIVLEDRNDIVLVTYDLIRVHLGNEGRLQEKLRVLEAILEDIWEEGVKVKSIHLQQYDNPVLRY